MTSLIVCTTQREQRTSESVSALPIIDDVLLLRCVARVDEIRSGAVDAINLLIVILLHSAAQFVFCHESLLSLR